MDAAGRAEQEFHAQTVLIRKPSREYSQLKEPLPCPSVLVNGRIIVRNDTISYQGLRSVLEGEVTA